MSFQLLARLLAHAEGAEFHPASVYTFEAPPVSIGTSPDCDCCPTGYEQLGDAPVAFRIVSAERGESFLLQRHAQTQIYVNDMPVEQEGPLKSGDLIRVNHLTFLFKELSPQFQQREKRRTDFFSALTKILIGAVLLSEIAAVLWLPQELQNYGFLDAQVTKRRTLEKLENLKQKVTRRSRPPQNYDNKAEELRTYAFRLLKREVDAIHTFVVQHQSKLSESQWRNLYADVQSLSSICHNLQNHNLFRTLPQFKARKVFKSITEQQDYSLDQLYE